MTPGIHITDDEQQSQKTFAKTGMTKTGRKLFARCISPDFGTGVTFAWKETHQVIGRY